MMGVMGSKPMFGFPVYQRFRWRPSGFRVCNGMRRLCDGYPVAVLILLAT